MRTSSLTKRRRLSVESLEHRYAPAGNVLATMVGGNLMVRGDGDANGLRLMFNADGTVEVSGVDAGGEATTINGSDSPFTATGIRFVTRINLGAGDDTLQIESEARDEAAATATAMGPQPLDRVGRPQAVRNELSGDLFSRQRLLINVGPGTDSVDAIVRNDLAVHMAGNSADDAVSIQTLADIAAELAADASLDPNVDDNPDSLANLSVDEAATAALIGASTANLTPNAVDAAFTDLGAQAQANANANFNSQASLLSNVGMNDSLGNGALNSNIGAGVSGAFQSQVGILPLG